MAHSFVLSSSLSSMACSSVSLCETFLVERILHFFCLIYRRKPNLAFCCVFRAQTRLQLPADCQPVEQPQDFQQLKEGVNSKTKESFKRTPKKSCFICNMHSISMDSGGLKNNVRLRENYL